MIARATLTPEQDAEIARLRSEGGHSLRKIAALYGFRSAGSVAHALRRHERRTGETVVARTVRRPAHTAVAPWEQRLRPLMKKPLVWQDAHEMPYRVAQATVTKLRQGRLSISSNGEWQFRSRKKPGADVAVVQAKWNGTLCTNCGALSPMSPCPLCGYDKEV